MIILKRTLRNLRPELDLNLGNSNSAVEGFACDAVFPWFAV